MFTLLKKTIRRLLKLIAPPIMKLCVRWPFFSNLYYCIDRSFEREHQSVLAGQIQYQNGISDNTIESHTYRLRRNTHRLEKGLISKPRRPVFALNYIAETVDSFQNVVLLETENAGHLSNSTRWALDVLSAYFQAITSNQSEVVDRLREKFNQTCEKHSLNAGNKTPISRDQTALPISIEQLKLLAIRRRSVRWYLDKPVPRNAIDQAIEIAGLSPSACNRQPFEFRIYDDPDLVRKLSSIPMGTSGFHHQFPVFVAIVGHLNAYPFARDRHVIYIDASLAAMAFQFALETQGIGSCSINWPDIAAKEKMIAKAINLTSDERVVMCLSLGFPDTDGLIPYSQKKDLDGLRSYNRT